MRRWSSDGGRVDTMNAVPAAIAVKTVAPIVTRVARVDHRECAGCRVDAAESESGVATLGVSPASAPRGGGERWSLSGLTRAVVGPPTRRRTASTNAWV